MKDHHSYQKVHIGGSNIAMLIVQSVSLDGMQLERLNFGEDGEYRAYIVDADCDVPESYEKVISHDGEGWVRIYDDETSTFTGRFKAGLRIYTRGEFGCIIQLL